MIGAVNQSAVSLTIRKTSVTPSAATNRMKMALTMIGEFLLSMAVAVFEWQVASGW